MWPPARVITWKLARNANLHVLTQDLQSETEYRTQKSVITNPLDNSAAWQNFRTTDLTL